MKHAYIFSFSLILIMIFPFTTLSACGQQESPESEQTAEDRSLESIVSEILEGYSSDNLSADKALAIHEAFKDQGLRGGPELDEVIAAVGFDPEILKDMAPPSAHDRNDQDDKLVSEEHGNPKKEEPVKIYESLMTDMSLSGFVLESSAVEKGSLLNQFKCEAKVDGIEKSIPLSWEGVPDGTESLAIVMYHYPHPADQTIVNSYLLLWGIDPAINNISYGMALNDEWFMGQNKDGNAVSYTSPCSPTNGGHNYIITIFALSEYPEALPHMSSIDVDFATFMDAIEAVEIIGKAGLAFTD